ncbi:MAG: diacylglycerol kinase family lipid kinase [Armatimonadetes bacterium]|nr:diacylglycerol kinase family lipid kinase [Armatimonadota bacterium]
MPKVGFVVNPHGGRGRALLAWKRFEEQFPGHPVYFTQGAGDGTHQAELALAEGCSRVAAVGGDGTINEVANALVGKDVELAVLPFGTGNDYAKTLGIGQENAFEVALDGKGKPVDVGLAEGYRHFINIAGIGFDAAVMTNFNHPGALVGAMPVKVRYYLSIAKTFASYRGASATLTIDEERTVVDALLLLAVGIAQFYGAGMHVLPMADIADGQFDLVWGQDVRLGELNKLMSLIYKGAHIGHPKVRTARCRSVAIETQTGLPFHLDGDVTGATPVTFRCLEGALRVAAP